MKANRIRAERRYRRPKYRYSNPSLLTPNRLEQDFEVAGPDRAWATDITYISTSEGWLYLAVIIDLFSRWVVGWSMSRRGNCYDNAVVESFFSSLKKERIRGKTYLTRDKARADIFDYIEVIYNRTRRYSKLGMLSPADFEQVKVGL